MKKTSKFLCLTLGALCVLFSSGQTFAGSDFWVVGEDGQPQPVEKHFFDLHDPTDGEQADATTAENGTDNTTPEVTTTGAELTEEDKELLVSEEESQTIEAAETAIKEKVVEKYKLQIDGIIQRLQEKVNAIPEAQRGPILQNMRDKVASKKPAVIESEDIDTLRKEILLEILDYIVQSLDPAALPELELESAPEETTQE